MYESRVLSTSTREARSREDRRGEESEGLAIGKESGLQFRSARLVRSGEEPSRAAPRDKGCTRGDASGTLNGSDRIAHRFGRASALHYKKSTFPVRCACVCVCNVHQLNKHTMCALNCRVMYCSLLKSCRLMVWYQSRIAAIRCDSSDLAAMFQCSRAAPLRRASASSAERRAALWWLRWPAADLQAFTMRMKLS